jgi:ABC-type antimicrobial peptide transport system permease subunit
MLIAVAVVVGIPLIWMAGSSWLSSFAYRSDLSPWYFVIGGIAIMLITLITVSLNTIKASKANPAQTLRNE